MPEMLAATRPSWRPERRSGLDPDLKRLGLIALALAAGMGLGLGAYSLLHHTPTGIPVVEAASGPVRMKPENAGGMTVAGSEDAAPGTVEKLAPPAEQPEIAMLRARLRAAQHALAKKDIAKPEPAKPPTETVLAQTAVAPPPPVQRAAALAPLPPAAVLSVQLGAFDSELAARIAWEADRAKSPELLAQRDPAVLRADLAGHPVWRLRTGGFANTRDAATFCNKIRQDGGDCSVAAF